MKHDLPPSDDVLSREIANDLILAKSLIATSLEDKEKSAKYPNESEILRKFLTGEATLTAAIDANEIIAKMEEQSSEK